MTETTFRFTEDTILEPDFVFYPKASGLKALSAATARLVVEVADSSLGYDLGRKAGLYAGFGIEELWVIDAVRLETRIHREPTSSGYRDIVDAPPGQRLVPAARAFPRRHAFRAGALLTAERAYRAASERLPMKIAILGGAGLMGTGIVRDLVSDRAIVPISAIRIADVSRPRIDALIGELADPRLEAFELDVNDPERLAAAVSGVDIVVNSVPTLLGHQMAIFEACLAAGVTYTDLGGLGTYTVRQKAMHERFRAAGVTAVIGTGSDPGMSNVICRAVADELDTIDSINLYWAAELVGPENPVLVPPYSISTVLAEYARPSTQFLDGRHQECAPMTGREVIDLPRPVGPLRVHVLAAFRAAHGAARRRHPGEGHPRVHLEAPPPPSRARGLGRAGEGRLRRFRRPGDARRNEREAARPARRRDQPQHRAQPQPHARAGEPRDPFRHRPRNARRPPRHRPLRRRDRARPDVRGVRRRGHVDERLDRRPAAARRPEKAGCLGAGGDFRRRAPMSPSCGSANSTCRCTWRKRRRKPAPRLGMR